MVQSSVLPDASLFLIDTSGSNVSIPAGGSVILKLFDSSGEVLVAAKSFAWERNGSNITLTDPMAVNQWMDSNGEGADKVRYDIPAFFATSSSENNTFSVKSVYSGDVKASSSYSWASSGGGGCIDCQVN